MLACINSLRKVIENMKGFMVIVVMIIVLVSFFMLSRYLVKRVEMGEDDMVLPVLDDEENVLYESAAKFRIGRDRTEFKLTRPGVINDIYLSRRSEPYDRSIRCRWSHLIEDGSLEQNRKFYKNITTKFGNQFKQLREIDGVAEKYSWTKNQNIKVMSNVYLSEVNAEILEIGRAHV